MADTDAAQSSQAWVCSFYFSYVKWSRAPQASIIRHYCEEAQQMFGSVLIYFIFYNNVHAIQGRATQGRG